MTSIWNILVCAMVLSSSSGKAEVLYEERGFIPSETVPELRTFEGKDPILDGHFRLREKPIEKCAKVAMKHGFRYFAIKHGAMCLTGPLIDYKFKSFFPRREEYLALYQVNIITNAKYVPLGCKRIHQHTKAFIPLPISFPEWPADRIWSSPEDALNKCSKSAAIAGFPIFGFHGFEDGMMCIGLNMSLDEIRVYETAQNCTKPGYSPKTGILRPSPQLFHLTKITNISVFDIGCYKRDNMDHAFPLLESHSDILGDKPFGMRQEPIKKCAIYAADLEHEFFSITDGGACAGSHSHIKKYLEEMEQSNKCSADGLGAENVNHVYRIVREIQNLPFNPIEPFTPLHVSHLGCFVVKDIAPIPTLEGTDVLLLDEPESRVNQIQKCAVAAHRRGFEVFAIMDGKCFSSRNARDLYDIYGHSKTCNLIRDVPKSMAVFEINIIRNPIYSNVGCYERCEPTHLLEGLHPLLQDEISMRIDPVRKCALAASLMKYDSFGLLNGGLCHGLFFNMMEKCIRSSSCLDEGLGGRFALQIYAIKEHDNFTLQNLGCWKDDAFRNIQIAEGATIDLTGRYTEREDAIGACARHARSRGFKVFALQAGGMCLTSEHAENQYMRFGWSHECLDDGKGGPWANQVYKLHEDWWEAPVQWWKVPKEWQPFGRWNCTWMWNKIPSAAFH